MKKISSGLLMCKVEKDILKVFLVHPGGPYWKNKDDGAWSIPKGEIDEKDKNDLLETAKREFKEETGIEIAEKKFINLGEAKSKNGKEVHAWGFYGDWSGLLMCESFVSIEWPYKSGKIIKFPEVDKAGFFKIEEAKKKIIDYQKVFLDRIKKRLDKK